MKSQLFLCLAMILGTFGHAIAQDAPKPPEEQKVGIYGFVRNDLYYNSRRNLDLRDGVLAVYPLDNPNLGSSADDANAVGQLGFSAIVTRLGVKFGGIKALGADATGILETDFFGISNGTAGSGTGTENLLRLRHAYVNLDWTSAKQSKTSLLIGQHWNPNFVAKCFPGVADFNTGIPFNPFGFMPQIRLTHTLKSGLGFMGMIFGYDLSGFSPAGSFPSGSGVDATKFSQLPSFAAQVSYEKKMILLTGGIEGNTLTPIIRDGSTNVNTTFFSLNLMFLAKLTTKAVTVKAYTNYGDLYTQYVGLGGFVAYKDSASAAFKYVANKHLNLWTEVILTKNKTFQPALFVGYISNLGLANSVNIDSEVKKGTFAVYGRAISTTRMFDNFLRISPRIDIYSGKLKLSLEYEACIMKWVNSNYADKPSAFTMQASTTANPFDAVNHRILFLMVYSF